jgi:Bifunctional DNA primase/polymerase, N-terminal
VNRKTSNQNTLLESALFLAWHGFSIFPCVPGGKEPAVKSWEQRATTDPDRITACWSAGAYNIGVACGPSRLVVIDLDMPKPDTVRPDAWAIDGVHDGTDVLAWLCEQEGQPFPANTYAVRTGRGGLHLYFEHPHDGQPLRNTSGTKGGGLGWLIDTRSHGGLVVGAGSKVGAGTYRLVSDDRPAPLPAWLQQRLQPAPLPPQRPITVSIGTDRRSKYLEAAVTAELARIANAGPGTRNTAVFEASVALGQLCASGALDTNDIKGMLTHAALKVGQRPTEATRTVASGLKTGAYRPRVVNA